MKKVLFVMQSLYSGGAEKSLVNLLNELPSDAFQIDLLLFKEKGMFLTQVPSSVNILNAPSELKKLFGSVGQAQEMIFYKAVGTAISRMKKKEGSERAAWRWENVYKQVIPKLTGRYDVAIAYISGEVMYYVADKVDAKKKIVWIHNDYRKAKHPREFDEPYLRQMNAIVSISKKCVDILKEEFPELSNRIYCIENITSSAVTRKRAEEFLPTEYDRQTPCILSIGRLAEQKGFDMAVDAAQILKDRKYKFKWYVIGSGELEEKIRERIKSNDVSDCFFPIGAKDNPYPYIKNCCVFVQTSRWEGKSVVLDEAKILCKPIVATNYPTVKDQIEDGKEGMVVPMTPEGIADGIQKLLESEELRNSYSEYLKAHEYGNQDEVQKYIDLIEGTI